MTSEYYAGRDDCTRCGADVKLSWADLCEEYALALGRSVPRGRTTRH